MARRVRGAPVEPLAAGVVLLLAAALVGLPIARLVQTAAEAGAGAAVRTLSAPGIGTALRNTLVLAVVVTVVAVPAGAAMALCLRRADVPCRGFLRVAVLLPVLVPPFVLGYSWTQAYGRAGFTDAVLDIHWPGVLGPLGVVVVLVANAAPIAYLLTAVGLATRAEPDLERAARASGASSLASLRTVTLPLLRPALAAAGLLTFVATLESFAVPQVMGAPAGFTTITTRIYSDLALASEPAAFVEAVTLALGLVALAAFVLTPADLVLAPRLRATRTAQAAGGTTVGPTTWAGRLVAAGLAGYLVLTVALPLLALVAAALTRAVGLPPTPGNWSLDNFREVLNPTMRAALGHSLILSAAAATLLAGLGGLVAAIERRPGGRGIGTLITLTFALPGSTLAVALLIAYGRWIGGTLALILLAYLAKLWALAHRPLAGALDRLPPAELQAARASGAALAAAVRTVVLRPLAPALLGAWLLVFLTALHEVTMSSLLYGSRSQTLAVVVLNSQELGQVGSTAALAVILTVLLLPALPVWWLIRRLQVRHAAGVGSAVGSEPAGVR